MYWLTGILGVILMFAPFLFGYGTNAAALWTSMSVGLIVAGLSWLEGIGNDKDNWEYWVAEVFGIFTVVSPFLFGFSTHTAALWSTISIGILIAGIAGSRILTGSRQYQSTRPQLACCRKSLTVFVCHVTSITAKVRRLRYKVSVL